jgi:hypothetical protein
MLVSMKSNLGTLVLVCCFILLCNGIRDAQAQYFSTASLYILNSNIDYDNAISSASNALYLRAPAYLYDAYINMYNASNDAYYGYYYGWYGYITYGTTTGYYCYLYAYNDYLYKSYATTDLYNTYIGYDYTSSLILDSYLGDYYNGYAAYYCGLSSIGGVY